MTFALFINGADMWWISPALVLALGLLSFAVNHGAFSQRLKNQEEKHEKLDIEFTTHKRDIWEKVDQHTAQINYLRGQHNQKANGKGAGIV